VFFILSFLGSYSVTGGLNTGAVTQKRLNKVHYIGRALALPSPLMLRYAPGRRIPSIIHVTSPHFTHREKIFSSPLYNSVLTPALSHSPLTNPLKSTQCYLEAASLSRLNYNSLLITCTSCSPLADPLSSILMSSRSSFACSSNPLKSNLFRAIIFTAYCRSVKSF